MPRPQPTSPSFIRINGCVPMMPCLRNVSRTVSSTLGVRTSWTPCIGHPRTFSCPNAAIARSLAPTLILDLRERQIATVLVAGVVTNICVRSTVHDAFFLGYEVVVPVECVAATSPQAQATSLYDIDTHYGTVAPLAQVLSLLLTH